MNSAIARQVLGRAGRWLQGAERALEDERWDDVVYCAQMAVEQSAKAVLLSIGIDFPKEHDVSDVLLQLADREGIPAWFRKEIPEISDVVAKLAEQRGLAGYGFEQGITAEYFRNYAPEALRSARKVHSDCKKFLAKTIKK
jgi:HEPN domain-containing protein